MDEQTSDQEKEDTGWQRVKAMWDIHEPAMEVEHLPTIILSSTFTAFFIGGISGARDSGQHYISNNTMTLYVNKAQAHREMHAYALMGFVRRGCRFGWRAGVFAATFTLISGTLNAYRNKVHLLHYASAGSIAGGLLNCNRGAPGITYGLLVGIGLSLPIGVLIHAFHAIIPQKYYDSMKAAQLERRKEREKKWRYQLTALDRIIDSMQVGQHAESEDAESLQESQCAESEDTESKRDSNGIENEQGAT